MSRARSLSPDENKRVIAAIRELRTRYRTQAALAGDLRVPDGSSTMSQFVVGKALRGEPVGVTFARAVAQLKGVTFEELVSGAPPSSGELLTTGDAGAFSQATLRGLAAKISAAEKRPHDPVTAAHLTETRVRIARFLHAQAIA